MYNINPLILLYTHFTPTNLKITIITLWLNYNYYFMVFSTDSEGWMDLQSTKYIIQNVWMVSFLDKIPKI